MLEEIKDIKSGKRELRQFGVTFSIVLGLLGGLFFLRGKANYFVFIIFSAAFLSSVLIAPILLKPLQKIWMSFGIFMGWLITRLILFILFYLVVTPIAVLARLFGKNFLDTKFDKNAASYWIAKETGEFDKRTCENQF